MKPFFRDEVQRNALGSPPNRELLDALQPKYWFAAHLHVKFKATVKHGNLPRRDDDDKERNGPSSLDLVPSQAIGSKTRNSGNEARVAAAENPDDTGDASGTTAATVMTTTHFVGAEASDPCVGLDLTAQMTKFLSLDKCLPRRQYLSIVHVPVPVDKECEQRMVEKGGGCGDDAAARLEYDPEWLAILRKTHHLSRTTAGRVAVPADVDEGVVTSAEVDWVQQRLGPSFEIPNDVFERTVPAHVGPPSPLPRPLPPPLPMMGNPQTDRLLSCLQLDHITTIPFQRPALLCDNEATLTVATVDENEIDVDDDDMDDEEQQDDNEIDIGDGADDVERDLGIQSEVTDVSGIVECGADGSDGGDGNSPKKPRVDTD